MDYDRILSALSKSGFYCDVRIITGVSSSLLLEDGKLSCTEGEISGIGVRALVSGSFGYAWSTRLRDFPELLKRAEKLARLNQGSFSLSDEPIVQDEKGKNFPFPETEQKTAMLAEAAKFASSDRTKNATLMLKDSNLEKLFLSSEGACISQKESHCYFSAVCIAKDGGKMQRGINRISSRKGYEKFDISAAALNAQECAERLLSAGAPPKGRFPVIMDPEMTGVFSHEALGHASEGDSILERESLLAGRLGEKIAADCVTIFDDPTFDGFGHYFYDDDGVRAQRVPIIEAGMLKCYLHSRQSASGLGSKSNGHARAEGWEFAPIVRMSNTLFSKGRDSESSVFDAKEAIYVIGMKGGSVDIFSGDFMFAAREAWLVRNGSKEKLLRDVTLSGNILETLAKVECVGKDFGTSPGFCGKMGQSVPVSDGGPHIRVSEMKVG